MSHSTLKSFLASVIAEQLPGDPMPPQPVEALRGGSSTSQPAAKPSLSPLAEKIADDLVREALASGLPLSRQKVEKSRLGGGNTAEVVAQVTLHAPFAFKLDQATKKLAEEGETMRQIKRNALPGSHLPERFRQVWPDIYAVRREPPYAYLMEFFPPEDGWQSLEDRLYPAGNNAAPSASDASRWLHEVLDILFTGFSASVNRRHKPSLMTDYFGRIRERLTKTAERDDRFASRPLLVNGQRLRPWKRYLDEIERHYTFLEQITPPFTTVTHGDPNPGNLMLRTTTAEVELKLIDPKDWMTGDYLFDVAKLTHFLEATGPAEKPAGGGPAKAHFRVNGTAAELDYAYGKPAWTDLLVDSCRERAAKFAAEHDDPHWPARYELGMAANLLGLPLGRLGNGREHAALILFGEGLKWLDRFCARLGASSCQVPVVASAQADEVEPEPLCRVRAWVREHVPGVVEAQDRRGFTLLHWEPVRPNDKNKPAELSLEHEVRLKPGDERALAKLLEALGRSEGRAAGEFLLGRDGRFDQLIVRRYDREIGAQSVDRYYDVPTEKTGPRLIQRQVTVRERLLASRFMTWSSASPNLHPLNLELPFVSLGSGGMTARLEFNWVDELATSLAEALAADTPTDVRRRNPLFIASEVEGLGLGGLAPVLEHTTYRQKFGLWQPAHDETPEREILVVNVDTVVAQDLETKRIGSYWDVDISGVNRVDAAELRQVNDFAGVLAARFGLQPNPGTKAWRDALVTGLLERWRGT